MNYRFNNLYTIIQKHIYLSKYRAGIGESDKRKRGYAFLPHSYGKFGKTFLKSAGIHFHAAEKKGTDHRLNIIILLIGSKTYMYI